MFLFERVFGFGIYMIVLGMVCLFLSKTKAPCKTTLRVYLLCLCIMAFFYKPYITADLYRTYGTIEFFSTMDFELFWNNFALDSGIPVARLLYWCVGKIGINALLPTFATFVCYSITFYIINKTREMYDISNKSVACVLFFIMSTSIYISVIGGIRMMLALCLIGFCFFRQTVEKKFRFYDVLLYMMAVFIHAMGFVAVGVCVVVALLDSNKSFARRVAYTVVALLLGLVFVTRFNDAVSKMIEKFLDYALGDRHSDPWEYIMGILIIAVLLLLFREYRCVRLEGTGQELKNFNSAAIWCVVIALCFFFEFSIFYRFGGQLAVLFAIPSLMITLEKTRGRPSVIIRNFDFRSILMLMSVVIAVISCTRGSLSSLKFFEL